MVLFITITNNCAQKKLKELLTESTQRRLKEVRECVCQQTAVSSSAQGGQGDQVMEQELVALRRKMELDRQHHFAKHEEMRLRKVPHL